MNKFIILIFIFFALFNGKVHANSNYKTRTIEESYSNLGYVSVDEAVKAFEQHFGQNLELPLRVPPIPFTHVFGRFNDSEGEQNDSFDMEFISEESSGIHFFINVKLAKYRMKIFDRDVVRVYKLNNGEKATYMNIRGANLLVFERGNFHYLFSANEKVSEKVTPEILVQIANSIDYSTK
ncbi:hypothetical protein AB1282_19900 [Gottfriedia sp. S16(2024)]|uniref:hypothetical protein n=1 Tax=Gottfriedia sp. S16(2024) TaxID=3162883 RepID=UPI003D1FB2EC